MPANSDPVTGPRLKPATFSPPIQYPAAMTGNSVNSG
jgi:hypothetical protein